MDELAREMEARRRLVRKEIAVRALCWLIIAPAIPFAFGCRNVPRWCTWLADKADALMERNGVRM